MTKLLTRQIEIVRQWQGPFLSGRLKGISGLLIEAKGPDVALGQFCEIHHPFGKSTKCEVVGFREDRVLLMTLGQMGEIKAGDEVSPLYQMHKIALAPSIVGRIVDAMGSPMDGLGPITPQVCWPLEAQALNPLEREPITQILMTQIKAIDLFAPIGQGQRIGIFSKAGVGKSTLLGMLAKGSQADVNVIALIGERGREVREFLEQELGKEGLSRSVVVVATADQPALLRCKGAKVATTIAEYFRSLGKNVLLCIDSLTRYAMALREIGIASYEPLAQRGYPPSVFAELPRLLERAGRSKSGSITAFYTILSEEDAMLDPIQDYARSLLDGHLVLSRALSEAHHFPPIDVLGSMSRLISRITSKDHQQLIGKARSLLHYYQKAEELINIGAYVNGSNPKIDEAIDKYEKICSILRQSREERHELKNGLNLLKKILL